MRSEEKKAWTLEAKHYFNQNAKVTSTEFHKRSNVLVVGFSSGIFALYELPEYNTIHTLSISSKKINTVRCAAAPVLKPIAVTVSQVASHLVRSGFDQRVGRVARVRLCQARPTSSVGVAVGDLYAALISATHTPLTLTACRRSQAAGSLLRHGLHCLLP